MPKVTLQPRDQVLRVRRGAALVDVADDHDTDLEFGCRDGICGTCIMTILKGGENLSRVSVAERDTLENFDASPAQRLACQVKILGDVEIHTE
jgi:ferredoxin